MSSVEGMPLRFLWFSGQVFGGPYRNKPPRMYGVNMGYELAYLASDTWVPTRDFSVPKPEILERGLLRAWTALVQGKDVYVGCFGGSGRTGLFLASLAKMLGYEDPVGYVRRQYRPSAVETKEQEEFVRRLPVQRLRIKAIRILAEESGRRMKQGFFSRLARFFP